MESAQSDNPIDAFLELFSRAQASEPGDHRACTLATADADGRPSARIVLLHGVDQAGFVFYTNFGSRKATQLAQNPHAALCCYWASLNVQVRIEGSVARLSDLASDAYFASRPRDSQIGAWASRQSETLDSRETLESRVRLREARFTSADVPRPPFWGGFLLSPTRIEFWKHRDSRLHDRRLFLRTDEAWQTTRLYP